MKAMSLAFLLTLACGCGSGTTRAYDPNSVISIQAGQICVAADSAFFKHLELGVAESAHAGGQQLRVVGQVVAVADNSDELRGSHVSWAQLDAGLSESLGLDLSAASPGKVGEAYGIADLPAEYAGKLSRGDSIAISRFGLGKYETSARVASLRPAAGEGDQLKVIFLMPPGEAWYPGNNCEVVFPMLKSRPVSLPTTALLHEGAQEYFLQETSRGHFRPRKISILDTAGESALVIGEVGPGDRVLSRGAILLKPFLHQVLMARVAGHAKGEGP